MTDSDNQPLEKNVGEPVPGGGGEPPANAAASPPDSENLRQKLEAEIDGQEQGAASPEDGEQSEEELRRELIEELERLVDRIKERSDYRPPPFSPRGLIALLKENLDQFPPAFQLGILERLRGTLNEDLLDLDTWKGIWYMLNYTIEYRGDQLKRRVTGEWETDEWGMDYEFMEVIQPFLDFMYQRFFRVETTGIENIPDEGRGLLVANHSGQLPWDGAMLFTAVQNEHEAMRVVRTLYASWFPTLPFISDIFVRMGQVLATVENGTRLLENDELVAVFPEGYKGVGKLFKDRYRLARFGRGGFVKMALKTRTPIIPVSIVGAEETYISLHKSETMARLTGFPYFPISARFPWLGPLGIIPLPTKWYMDFGEPVSLDQFSPEDADDPVLVSQLTDQVRNLVQDMLFDRLVQRRSVFFG